MTNRDFIEVTNYTSQVRTQLAQVNYGAQDLFYKQDSSGRLTGDFTDEKEISFENTENYIDTNFKPEIDEYTIYEVVNEEFRVLKSNNSYKVNDVAQTDHSLPDSTTNIRLNKIATIGEPDIVDTTDCLFRVFDKLTTDTEDTDDYQAWLGCNAVILTDDYGLVLTDSDDKILIV